MVDIRKLSKFQLNYRSPMSKGNRYFIFDDVGDPLFYVNLPELPGPLDLGLYAKESRTDRVYTLKAQSVGKLPKTEFVFYNKNNRMIAAYVKNELMGYLKAAWEVYTDEQYTEPVACIEEDASLNGLWRKVLKSEHFFKTNFNVRCGETKVGTFRRRDISGTLHVLDLVMDPGRKLNREVALGLALVLDIGESV